MRQPLWAAGGKAKGRVEDQGKGGVCKSPITVWWRASQRKGEEGWVEAALVSTSL